MKVCVAGLWHLGSVMAACLADGGHEVCGFDEKDVTGALARGEPPVAEPGLADLVTKNIREGRLRFDANAAAALRGAEVVWIAYDTPVDDDDRADVDAVMASVQSLFPHIPDGALVLISSQLPVGSTRRLEDLLAGSAGGSRGITFGCSPENLRLGKAIQVFTRPDRVVVGLRSVEDRPRVETLLAPFTDRIEWMSVESAEMTKHALNAFLATSVVFINEIAALCEQVGADAKEVERGLKSEQRIGPSAYLGPGGAFAGGTLARDVQFLSELGQQHSVPVELIGAVKTSNDGHRGWEKRRLQELLGPLAGRRIAVWGLTYKPGTDTLRRSSAITLCEWLLEQGAVVVAHDPAVKALPPALSARMEMAATPLQAATGAAALVIMTEWPDYRAIGGARIATAMNGGLVLDANRFLGQQLASLPGVRYVAVGTSVR